MKGLDWKRGNLLVWSLLPGLSINLFQPVDKGKNDMGSRAWDALSFFQHSRCTTSTQLSLALARGHHAQKVHWEKIHRDACSPWVQTVSVRREIPAQCVQHHLGHFRKTIPNYSLPGAWEWVLISLAERRGVPRSQPGINCGPPRRGKCWLQMEINFMPSSVVCNHRWKVPSALLRMISVKPHKKNTVSWKRPSQRLLNADKRSHEQK